MVSSQTGFPGALFVVNNHAADALGEFEVCALSQNQSTLIVVVSGLIVQESCLVKTGLHRVAGGNIESIRSKTTVGKDGNSILTLNGYLIHRESFRKQSENGKIGCYRHQA